MASWKKFTFIHIMIIAASFAQAAPLTGSELRTRMVNAIIKAKQVTNLEAEAEIVSPLTSPYQTLGVGVAFIGQILNETGVLGTNGLINYYPYEVVYRFKDASGSLFAANCTLDIYASELHPERFLVHSHTCSPFASYERFVSGTKDLLDDYEAIVIVGPEGDPVFVKPLGQVRNNAGLAALLNAVW